MVDKVDDDIYETCLYTILAYQQQQHGEDKQCSHCILMLDLYQPYIRYDVCSKKIKSRINEKHKMSIWRRVTQYWVVPCFNCYNYQYACGTDVTFGINTIVIAIAER